MGFTQDHRLLTFLHVTFKLLERIERKTNEPSEQAWMYIRPAVDSVESSATDLSAPSTHRSLLLQLHVPMSIFVILPPHLVEALYSRLL